MKCIYCGSENDITREHIIPKGLFPKPRPSNLITAPACGKCNNGKSSDDEYLINSFNIAFQVNENPSIKMNRDKIIRGLQRKEKESYRKSLIASSSIIRNKDINSKFKYIPTTVIDPDRINMSVSNIVRGLVFSEDIIADPTNYEVETIWANYQKNDDGMKELHMLDRIPWRVIGDSVFGFKYALDNETRSTVWLTKYYEHFLFVTFVTRKNNT